MVVNHHHQLHLLALGEATHHATQKHTDTSIQLTEPQDTALTNCCKSTGASLASLRACDS